MPQAVFTKLFSQNQGSEGGDTLQSSISASSLRLPVWAKPFWKMALQNLCSKHAPQLKYSCLLKIKQAGCAEILAKPRGKQFFASLDIDLSLVSKIHTHTNVHWVGLIGIFERLEKRTPLFSFLSACHLSPLSLGPPLPPRMPSGCQEREMSGRVGQPVLIHFAGL